MSKILGPWNIGEPVHEVLTLLTVDKALDANYRAYLMGMKVEKYQPGKSGKHQIEFDPEEAPRAVQEYIRGVTWPDDPRCYLFDSALGTSHPSSGKVWYDEFTEAEELTTGGAEVMGAFPWKGVNPTKVMLYATRAERALGVIETLNPGTGFEVLEARGEWLRVSVQKEYLGYISQELITRTGGAAKTSSKWSGFTNALGVALRDRASKGGASRVLANLPLNTGVTVLKREGSWLFVSVPTLQGFIPRKLINYAGGKDEAHLTRLIARSHFGDLQFLHAMAQRNGESPQITKECILEWASFLVKIAAGEIKVSELVRNHTERITGIYGKGADANLQEFESLTIGRLVSGDFGRVGNHAKGHSARIDAAALTARGVGMLLHLIQDSFAAGHVQRSYDRKRPTDPKLFGEIEEFHAYGSQDHSKGNAHDAADYLQGADTLEQSIAKSPGKPQAIHAGKEILRLLQVYSSTKATTQVMSFLDKQVFKLARQSRAAGPGIDFSRKEGQKLKAS